jgi:hypothetical protein
LLAELVCAWLFPSVRRCHERFDTRWYQLNFCGLPGNTLLLQSVLEILLLRNAATNLDEATAFLEQLMHCLHCVRIDHSLEIALDVDNMQITQQIMCGLR